MANKIVKINPMKEFYKRFISSCISILIVIALVIFSPYLFMRPVLGLIIACIATIGAIEYLHLAQLKHMILSRPVLVGGVICEVVAFFIMSQYPELRLLPLIVFFLFVVVLFIRQFNHIQNAFSRIAYNTLGFLYVAIPMGMLLPILYLSNIEDQDGRIWLFYLIFVTKITDIAAYFGGKLFKGKKLAKKISPKKTISGAISGLIFAVALSICFSFFQSDVFDLSLIESIILGIIFGVASQLGDLFESLLKRDAKIKDSGRLYGLGGILDTLDSLIINIFILYFFLIG